MTTKQFNETLRNIKNAEYFDLFFNEYYPQIIKISMYLYHDYQDARDVAQEIFKYLLTHKIKNYIENPKSWLFALCKYNGLKLFKKEIEINENTNYYQPIYEFLSLEIRNASQKLNDDERVLIVLIWFYGYLIEEISEILHKSYHAIAKKHERIKKKLKNILSI